MIRGELKVVVDDAALQALINSPDGPVAKELARLGGRIEGTAKELVSGPLLSVDTGRLRSSISWKLFTQGGKVGVAVGAGVAYAEVLHDGGSRQWSGHTRRSRNGGSHQVRAHTKTYPKRPFIAEAARRNGVQV